MREEKKGRTKRPLSKGKKIALFCMAVCAGAAAVFYIAVYMHFKTHTALNTTIDGIDISNQTASEVQEVIQQEADAMVMTITAGDKSMTASAADLGITTDVEAETERALATGKNRNPFEILFGEHDLQLSSTYDASAADTYVNTNFAELITSPVDAAAVYDAGSSTYVLQAGAHGKIINTDDFHTAIEAMIADPAATSYTLQQMDDAAPSVTDEMAQSAADRLNRILAQGISITSDGAALYTIQPADIAGWTSLAYSSETGTYDYSFNTDAITSFVTSAIDPQITQPTVDKAVINDASGNVIKVLSTGQNGIEPAESASDTAAKIVSQLNSGTGGAVDIAVTEEACGSSSITASDDRYIEYNRSTYTVTLWDGDTVCWSTDQTADGKASTPTITGLYSVLRKTYVTSMPNPPSPEPLENIHYVTYWEASGYAFHEAWWLTQAKIHTGISHGCINMWIDDAKTVYDFAVVGMPVWVHD